MLIAGKALRTGGASAGDVPSVTKLIREHKSPIALQHWERDRGNVGFLSVLL